MVLLLTRGWLSVHKVPLDTATAAAILRPMNELSDVAPLLPFIVALIAYTWVVRRATDPMDGRAERRRDRFE